MSLNSTIAALRSKAANGDKKAAAELKAHGISLTAGTPPKKASGKKASKRTEGTEPEEEEDGEDPEAEGDEDDPNAEGDEDDPNAEGDGNEPEEEEDENDPEANANRVLSSPEAKGREQLAGRLAVRVGTGKMTVKDAIADLRAAPKSSGLDARMAAARHGAKPGTGASQSKESPLVASAREFQGR